MLFDTTFLIDLERETTRGRAGRAIAFLETRPDVATAISIISYGELAEGCEEENRAILEQDLQPWTILGVTRAVAWQYGRISGVLRREGTRIGDNDIWIAATAMVHGFTLVTRNTAHFDRVAGLALVDY